MQVSWIDPDEVRDLVALLAEPAARDSSTAPDLETLPGQGDRFPFEFLSEQPAAVPPWVGGPTSAPVHVPAPVPMPAPVHVPVASPVPLPPPAPIAPAAPTAPSAVDVALQPDVSRIRAKLRVIRDRAAEAGLLGNEASTPSLPPTPPAPTPVSLPRPELPPAPTVPAPTFPSLFQLVSPPPSPSPSPVSGFTAPTSPLFSPASPSSAESVTPAPSAPAESVTPAESALDTATGSSASHWAAPEHTTIVERLDEFARWSTRLTTSEELFMLDDHGDLIWGSPTSDGLLVCAKLAMNASMRSQSATLSKPAPAMAVQVSPGKELQLISCATRHGNVTLALVNPREVPAADLRDALIEAVNA